MSKTGLRIASSGPGVTIQDGGRHGFLRYGATESGPMDRFAHALANRAAGVTCDSAAIEVSLGGVEIEVEGKPITLAVAGGNFDVRVDGRKLPAACVVYLAVGQKLSLKAGIAGAWSYIAAAGKFDLEPVLGSVAMHTRSGIGGSGLQQSAFIEVIGLDSAPQSTSEILTPGSEGNGGPIRVIAGPQDDYFAADEIEKFLNSTWTVSNRGDRMGYLLEGPKLKHSKGFNIVSDATSAGSIQVPGDGQPIVLMADRPTTGGYPKIATVIGADVGRLAQLRPGEAFRFAVTSINDSVLARRRQAEILAKPILVRPISELLRSEELLRNNLVSGIANGNETS